MGENYVNNFRFFANEACEYFPCHKTADKEAFNCLFCYCPLYFLGDKCGGNFKLAGLNNSIKDCSDCLVPHKPENYELIVKIIRENINQF